MSDRGIIVVCDKRAQFAALTPLRIKHEVVDDELASTAKKVSQSLFAIRTVEDIILFDFFPGQIATLPAQIVAQP
jgi:hypothetical protein